MATLDGSLQTGLELVPDGEKGHFIFYAGSNAALGHPDFTYFLAAFDTLGNRYYWSDDEVSLANAPPPAGVYVASTLLVMGRI
jgi:hypothetical protein